MTATAVSGEQHRERYNLNFYLIPDSRFPIPDRQKQPHFVYQESEIRTLLLNKMGRGKSNSLQKKQKWQKRPSFVLFVFLPFLRRVSLPTVNICF